MREPDDLVALEISFVEIATRLFARGTVAGTLQQIVDLAEQAVDGCDAAGVFVLTGDTATTPAASGPLAISLDQLQLEADEGPCLEACRSAATIYAEDLRDDSRWPSFGSAALSAGVRSVLAYSLSADQPSALNLYGELPLAFGATDRAKGQLFATLARLALDSAKERAADQDRAEHLTEALRTRELIGQAQGILMERERITADQAFDVLRRASQRVNLKLRDVADALVETGETPGPEVTANRPSHFAPPPRHPRSGSAPQ